MSFNLNCWLKETIDIDSLPGVLTSGVLIFQKVRPRIVCNDGFSVSVQASEYAYCYPRYTQWQTASGWQVVSGEYWLPSRTLRNFETDHFTPYESVELGYPSEADELIHEYAEDDDYTNTVYGNVPVEVVEKLIEKHGGLKGGRMMVAIKGMKLPHDCDHCQLRYDNYSCIVTGTDFDPEVSDKQRLSDCPLVEIEDS